MRRPARQSTPTLLLVVVLGWCMVFEPSCSPSNQADAAKAAECEGIRGFYDAAQTELLERGACGDTPAPQCVPHVALREALIASLKERACPGSSTTP